MATATKANSVIDNWTEVIADVLVAGSNADVSTTIAAGLMVTVVHVDTDANANGMIVEVQGKYGADDDDWHNLYSVRMGAGTATTATLDDTTSTNSIPVGATTNFETEGIKGFIYESGTPANSELVQIATWVAGDSLTTVDNLTRTHASGIVMYNDVHEKLFPLPDEIATARVICTNDDWDADMAFRVDLAEISSVG